MWSPSQPFSRAFALSPPLSSIHTASHWYICQVAGAAPVAGRFPSGAVALFQCFFSDLVLNYIQANTMYPQGYALSTLYFFSNQY